MRATLVLFGALTLQAQQIDSRMYSEMRWRMIGPHRASRTKAAAGIPDQPNVFYMGVVNGGVTCEALKPADLRRAHELMGTYKEIGFADATVVAVAERMAFTTIATTDRRHFGMVRPAHTERFTLVP